MQGRCGGSWDLGASLQASTSSWLTGLFLSASNIEERYSSFQPGMLNDSSIRGVGGAAGVGTSTVIPIVSDAAAATDSASDSDVFGLGDGDRDRNEVDTISQSSSSPDNDDASMCVVKVGGQGGPQGLVSVTLGHLAGACEPRIGPGRRLSIAVVLPSWTKLPCGFCCYLGPWPGVKQSTHLSTELPPLRLIEFTCRACLCSRFAVHFAITVETDVTLEKARWKRQADASPLSE